MSFKPSIVGQQVDRVETITKEDFIKNYFKPQKPVVIERFIEDWPAFNKWSLEYMKEVAGDKTVPLYDDRPVDYKDGFNEPHATMKMSEYVDLLKREPTKFRIFLWNVLKEVPVLQKDFKFPDFGLRLMKGLPMLFFGGRDSYTFMHYDIAANCMSCHGLVRDEIEPDIFEKIIAANHPANNDFEFIKYSQGSVRHRFYPPNDSVNAEPSAPELSRLFVIGQAAKLVSASAAAKRAPEGAYKAFQTQRVEDAREVLARITDVDAIKALMDAPTEENGRNLADAIKDKDLSSKVGSLLPAKDAYK